MRPLSAWIAHFEPRTGKLGPVNDGDDRADARSMDCFSGEWRRVGVEVEPDRFALGLTDTDGTIVVELDDFGAPITVGPAAIVVIDRIEQSWPDVGDGVVTLADEALPLRYWLMERLATESDPPDEVFAILPWDLLDRATAAVTAGLESIGDLGEMVRIQHWLTPALIGLAGPIEQLDHGLRTGDGQIARLGASALLSVLRDLPLSRIPQRSIAALDRLVGTLGRIDPLYRHTARVVSARLTGTPAHRLRVSLNSALVAAAGTDDIRENIEFLDDDLQRVQLVQTQAGSLRILVRVGRPAESPLSERAGVFQPVRIVPRDGAERLFWIAMYPEGDALLGAMTVVLPPGWSDVDVDDMPVDTDDLRDVDPETLLASLYASSAPTAQYWLDLAEGLPFSHPVRRAATKFEESL